MDAFDYPTITLGDRTLVVRFSLAAQILMIRRGIDPANLATLLAISDPLRTDRLLQVFAACVAENFLDPSAPTEYKLDGAPTSDYWASQCDLVDLRDIDIAIGESMGKVREALNKKRARVLPIPIQQAG